MTPSDLDAEVYRLRSEGKLWREIAAALGVSIGRVYQRYRRYLWRREVEAERAREIEAGVLGCGGRGAGRSRRRGPFLDRIPGASFPNQERS